MINAGVIEQYWYVWEGGGKGGVKLIIMYSTCLLFLWINGWKNRWVGLVGIWKGRQARSQATVRGREGASLGRYV